MAKPAPPTAEARAQAERLLRENADGLRDMQNLTLSMGLPMTRAVFRQMVTASGKRGAVKRAAKAEIVTIPPVTEIGCMEVNYYDVVAGAPGKAYLRLAECPRGHDLDAQLGKLRPRVADDGWGKVLQNLGILIRLGRSIYTTVAQQKLGLIRQLFDLGEADGCERFLDLQVDAANTTLFLDAAWPNRIGIYVDLASDFP